eukprot:EG_transcript_32037
MTQVLGTGRPQQAGQHLVLQLRAAREDARNNYEEHLRELFDKAFEELMLDLEDEASVRRLEPQLLALLQGYHPDVQDKLVRAVLLHRIGERVKALSLLKLEQDRQAEVVSVAQSMSLENNSDYPSSSNPFPPSGGTPPAHW